MEKQFFIFGDSITYGAIDREGGWTNRLRKYLDNRMIDSGGKEFFMLYNLGVSGDTTADLLARFEQELVARMDASEEAIVIFAIGINDSQHTDKEDSYRVNPTDFESNIVKLHEQAKGKGAARIVFIGLTDVDESRTMPVSWAKGKYYDNESIQKYEKIIRAFCETNHLLFIPMRGVLSNADLADGLHPNTRGFEKMFKVIKESVETSFLT
ncbi:MAG: hypothetical protein KGI71_03725 [Patescibacteria group bacterium]|nr:hypothetical protein [Patescibacteria group bacterium]